MLTLNPLGNPDAWWQHAIMILIAAGLGYIIGYIETNKNVLALENKLNELDTDLTNCNATRAGIENKIPETPGEIVSDNSSEIKYDDLKIIEGIGPKIEEILNSEGIYTFRQLSIIKAEQLIDILQNSGTQFQMHDPRTWPQQAQLAANGMMEQLQELQNELNKGRQQ